MCIDFANGIGGNCIQVRQLAARSRVFGMVQHTNVELLKAPGMLDLSVAMQVILFCIEDHIFLGVFQLATVFRRLQALLEAIALIDTVHVDIRRESGSDVAVALQQDLERRGLIGNRNIAFDGVRIPPGVILVEAETRLRELDVALKLIEYRHGERGQKRLWSVESREGLEREKELARRRCDSKGECSGLARLIVAPARLSRRRHATRLALKDGEEE